MGKGVPLLFQRFLSGKLFLPWGGNIDIVERREEGNGGCYVKGALFTTEFLPKKKGDVLILKVSVPKIVYGSFVSSLEDM